MLIGYELVGLRYREDLKDAILWIGFFLVIGIWGGLSAYFSRRLSRQQQMPLPITHVAWPTGDPSAMSWPMSSSGRGLGCPTRQECNVLRLVARGLTNERIASELNISSRTVKKHLENVFKRLDVHDRESAARVARERGCLD